MISTTKAAELIGVSLPMVHKLIKQGELKAVEVDGPGRRRKKWSVDKHEVENYITKARISRETKKGSN